MSKNSGATVVVTVGVFDGVHAGHRALLAECKKIAGELNANLVAATFDPSPKSFLNPEHAPGLLTLPARRTELLKIHGADQVVVLEFDANMAAMSPEEFVNEILVSKLSADLVVIGSNFRFGHKAAGSIETLRELALAHDFDVRVVDLAGDTESWSSTRVRSAISAGDVDLAREILGRPHRLTGEVVHGDHRGRELGYPTANLDVAGELLIPADGVYAGVLEVAGERHPAAISVGTNPTFEGVIGRRVEAYVLDRNDLNLYGEIVDLDFLAHIRDMAAFSGVAELLVAMENDVNQARIHTSAYLETL